MTALTTRALPVARRTSALYCATYGRGTPLLLIHGFGASGAVFDQLVPSLAARHTVIIPDLRGHGNSSRLPLADSIGRLAADLDDLLDLLGSGPAFVFGHGGGGAVAQQLTRDHPGRVRGLVLTCACACGVARRPTGVAGLRGLAGLLRDRGERAGACSSTSGDRLLQSFDSRPWLAQLGVPALVVTGDADTQVAPQQARELTARLPLAQLEVIPGAGHWLIQTHAERLVDLTLSWIRQQESAA